MKKHIIPIFIPHYGCPHSCVFCNQNKITGLSQPIESHQIESIIKQHLLYSKPGYEIEVAFYGGSFTALPLEVQEKLLMPAYNALRKGFIHCIRLSTRPDCISPEILSLLKSYGVSTVELGVQSMDDDVLLTIGRGHAEIDTFKAVHLIKETSIKLGIQLMVGLPKEKWLTLIKTAHKVIGLHPDFVRIYPTIVLPDTQLAVLFSQGLYAPLSLSEAVRQSALLKLLFQKNEISVIRTGLQSTEELSAKESIVAGPYHPAFGEMVESYLFYVMISRVLSKIIVNKGEIVVVHHHPRDASKIRGIRSQNRNQLKMKYHLKDIVFLQTESEVEQLIIQLNNLVFITNRKMLFHL